MFSGADSKRAPCCCVARALMDGDDELPCGFQGTRTFADGRRMSDNSDSTQADSPDSRIDPGHPQFPRLVIDAVDAFNYAAWQNAIPLLRRLEVDNREGVELSSLTIELRASTGFVRPKLWTVDRVRAGSTVALRDIDLEIDPAYLDRLDESERGVLTFTLTHREGTLHEARHELRVLARDEWGGLSSMGELLPAFVTPNDPALPGLLKAAGMALGDAGHSTALDGYQSGDPNRAYLLAAALWSAVAARSLTYANPPTSFEKVGQKVRRVGTVLGDGLATCLDSTLLFASGLEAIGLNPVIAMTNGHCFAGLWVVSKNFTRLVEPDCGEVRKAIAARELIVFETTVVTHRPPLAFPKAVDIATAAVSIEKEHNFVAVIDVGRGRMSEIRPLASRTERVEGVVEEVEAGPLSLPAAPGFDKLPLAEADERPKTPEGRIERWQRKLLDLSLRNRLLNFRTSRQTVPVCCPNVSRLEDHLANGRSVRLVPLSEANPLGGRDAELHQRRTAQDLDREFARKALERDELACPLQIKELETRLTALYRKVRNDLAEGGSNTLYLAVGFLRWKRQATDDQVYRAPLILVPVKLERSSASSPFHLKGHEDDVRFNATLLQLLKKDFDCDLTRFETDLPTDDSGVDVSLILERMRHAVRNIPGFEVLEDATIGTFSFAKYLMWRDLVDRLGQLEQNRVVRHLIRDPDKPFVSATTSPAPRPHELDTRYAPHELVHPLPADSSQLAAVMAAAEGHDFVIVGPPGTGKSQTIANLIAQCLAIGKTVLFVAEKTAALDVVHRRLREHGLGDCCVELHSNKAERRRFLDQLDASWSSRRPKKTSDWVEVNERLRVRRDQLNAYVAAAHVVARNGWTAHRAMGESVRGRDVTTPPLEWPAGVSHERAEYEELEATIARLASAYRAVNTRGTPLRVQAREWSLAWENGLLEACRQIVDSSAALETGLSELFGVLGLPAPGMISSTRLPLFHKLARELAEADLPPAELLLHERLDDVQATLDRRGVLLREFESSRVEWRKALDEFQRLLAAPANSIEGETLSTEIGRLVMELHSPDPRPSALVFHSRFESLVGGLSERETLLRARHDAREALIARSFSRALLDRIPVEDIERDWVAATRAFWPLSIWKRRGLLQRLRTFMGPASPGSAVNPAPDIDIPLLSEYRDAQELLAGNLSDLGLPAPLQTAVEKDSHALDGQLRSAGLLRDAFVAAGLSPEAVGRASKESLSRIVEKAKQLHAVQARLDSARRGLHDNLAELGLSPELAALVRADDGALDTLIARSRNLRELIESTPGVAVGGSSESVRFLVEAPRKGRVDAAVSCYRAAKAFQGAWSAYTQHAEQNPAEADSPSVVASSAEEANRVRSRRTELKSWTNWRGGQERAKALGLSRFAEAVVSGMLDTTNAVDRFRLAYARWWLPSVIDHVPALRTFQKFLHEEAIADFQRLDELARKAAAPQVRLAVFHDLPKPDDVPRKSELGLLRHQMTLKRPSRSIRDMISGMPEAFSKLAPCLLMSPLSIAQYLPANHPPFDVVVFDEASQIATWDAIGAIARGAQTIIVGDPKQLPPTNFFGKADDDEGQPDLEDHEKDLESILDEARASGLPTLQLNWHYRSRHESLIAFSNFHYYGNRLITFPAAESTDRGVSLRHVPVGVYDRGKSRTNRIEAEAIVADLVDRMRRALRQPVAERSTFGVVTFNIQQQELIQDLLDAARRQHPVLEWFFADDRIEPTAVKNLENVQGDERDVMLFSITFGFDAAGKFPVDFGAINREGGERRLNVAVTRARRELVVFASFLPDQFPAERSGKRGILDLKAFLQYAERGPRAMLARTDGSEGDLESPLEEAVAAALQSRGWRLDPQVGVSGFRIDLGIIHPDKPGTYLAGIECDGATYHRASAARDRDTIRQQVLEGLGWTILRVWSTDWWYAPEAAIETLDTALNGLLQRDRERPTSVEKEPEPSEEVVFAEVSVEETGTPPECATPSADSPVAPGHTSEQAPIDGEGYEVAVASAIASSQPQPSAAVPPSRDRRLYLRADLGDASANQDRFFDSAYTESLRGMARAVLDTQGPILEEALARDVARAHGFGRTGHKIQQRVLELLPDVTVTTEPSGRFLWPGVEPLPMIPFRYPPEMGDRRPLDEIPTPELLGLIHENSWLLETDDPALALARELGLARLSRGARERLEAVLETRATAADQADSAAPVTNPD
jgi:very-short-patch-repair endonuclease